MTEPVAILSGPLGFGGQVRVPKAAEIVSNAIRRRIVRAEIAEGTMLPSEMELMNQFGVSRPTLREAIRILESEGLVTVNRGAKGGAVVHQPNLSVATRYLALILQVQGTTIGEIYRVHALLEPPAARLVAEGGNRLAAQALRDCLDQSRRDIDNDLLFGTDTARFRNTLVDLAGIPTLTLLASVLNEILERSWSSLTATAGSQVDNQRAKRRGLRSIETLIELIEAGDGDGAEAHWRHHTAVAEKMMRNWLDSTRLIDLLDD